jgi:hypothetical protein
MAAPASSPSLLDALHALPALPVHEMFADEYWRRYGRRVHGATVIAANFELLELGVDGRTRLPVYGVRLAEGGADLQELRDQLRDARAHLPARHPMRLDTALDSVRCTSAAADATGVYPSAAALAEGAARAIADARAAAGDDAVDVAVRFEMQQRRFMPHSLAPAAHSLHGAVRGACLAAAAGQQERYAHKLLARQAALDEACRCFLAMPAQ